MDYAAGQSALDHPSHHQNFDRLVLIHDISGGLVWGKEPSLAMLGVWELSATPNGYLTSRVNTEG
jgi:hypothetical protein